MEELLQILNKLEENTNIILEENKRLENEIKSLKGESTEIVKPEYNYDGGFYRDSINRAYYVVFYAIKAILALEGIDFKRHKDAIGYFNKNYVATGILPRDVGKYLGRIKLKREEGDYTDFYIASETSRKWFNNIMS